MPRFLSLRRVALLAALLLVEVSPALHAQTRYSVLDIGSLSSSDTWGSAVNAKGQVVGWSLSEADLTYRAFRTEPNRPINPATDNLGTFLGSPSEGYGVNIWGQAVGVAYEDLVNHAFRTEPNRSIISTDDLGALGGPGNEGYEYSEAYGINIWGQVVGAAAYLPIAQYGITWRPQHAFRTDPNRPMNPTDDLGTFGGANSYAYGINDWGQAVGTAYFSDDTTYHAFRTAPNRPINPATDDLGTLGGMVSEADGINDWGQVVGAASTSDNASYHAFRTAPNRLINPATDDLGTLGGGESEALSINNRGDVVGYSDTSSGGSHAFIFTGGVMYDLNDLIPTDLDIVLDEAESINDVGQIVALGQGSTGERTFLLTPARR